MSLIFSRLGFFLELRLFRPRVAAEGTALALPAPVRSPAGRAGAAVGVAAQVAAVFAIGQ